MDTDPDRQDLYADPDPDLEKILPILPDPELIPREELIHIDNVQKTFKKGVKMKILNICMVYCL